MSKTLKKVFSFVVSLTTIAWSVGVGTIALPSVASAATLNVGDLIKASGPAVYFYANDLRRYVFPNEKTYFSWYNDFSAVKTITDSELAAIAIGGNVTIRPGTKLVKITTDPKVYAVTDCGVLHWVQTEALAASLYGSAWAARVVDVPDAFFPNYTIGSAIATAVHPDGTLIMYAGSSNQYVTWGGQKRMFAAGAFAANNYNAANIITTTIAYPDGAAVTGRESALADTVCTGAAIGTGLTVSLASDTPAGMTVPKNATGVPLAKFNFTAGASAVNITGLTVHRVGIGATTDFANVYLYDGNGNRLTSGRTINTQSNQVAFNSLSINVPAGATVSVLVTGDFAGTSITSTGGQHAFEIADAASVVVGQGTVAGSFPVRGNVFTVGTTLAARVDVQKGIQPQNPTVGSSNVEISNFKITANTNDISLYRVTLYQTGSVSNTDLSNFNLYDGATIVATASAIVNNHLVLNFTPPYLITNGTTKTFSLHASVAGRTGRTIITSVEYPTDVYAIDRVYNSGAQVCTNTTASGCSGSLGSFDGSGTNFISVTTQGGNFTIAFNGPPSSNIPKGTQNITMYNFALTSQSSDVLVRNLRVMLKSTGLSCGSSVCTNSMGAIQGSAGTQYFRNIKVVNTDTGATVAGPLSYPSGTANGASFADLVFTDTFTVPAGQTLHLAIRADTANTEDLPNEFFGSGTSTYQVNLDNGSSGNATAGSAIFNANDLQIVQTGEYFPLSQVVPNSPLNGNIMTVQSSNLVIGLAATPSSGTVVQKQANVPSVGFTLQAGTQSDVLVTSIKITGSATTTPGTGGNNSAASLVTVVTSCALFDGSTQVGLAQAPDATLGTMTISSMNYTVPAGQTKTLVAKCTMGSNSNATTKFALGIAAPTDVAAQDTQSNTVVPTLGATVVSNASLTPSAVVMTVLRSGTITIATDNLRQSTILVAGGSTWQNLAQFKATAQFENVLLDRVSVTSTGDAANFSQIAVAKDGAVLGTTVFSAGTQQVKDIDISGSPITVPMGGSVDFQIWGQLAPTQSSSSVSGATTGVARSGNTMSLGLGIGQTTGAWDTNYVNQYNVRSTGVASGNRVYATTTVSGLGGTLGNVFVLRRTKPTVTRQSLSTTTLAPGDMDLYKAQISADSMGSASVKKIVFNFSKATSSASSLAISNFRLRNGSTDMTLANYTVTDGLGTNLQTGSWNVASSSGIVVVAFTNEETISGSGNVYTLHATIGGTVVAGDSINLSFLRNADGVVRTGYLIGTATTTAVGGSTNLPGPNIDQSVSPGSGGTNAIQPGTFVWSDQSEVPHSTTVGSTSSRDWSDDVYVDDLTNSQVLSR